MSTQDQSLITLVSGLPRSGTSLMMSMLQAGGLPLLVDHIRQADDDNPKGYYEFERVKKAGDYEAWLPTARGKAVKMISAFLAKLPLEYHYKVLFMRRNLLEVLASQRQMLVRRGAADESVTDEQMEAMFQRHLQQVERWLADHSDIGVLYVDYAQLIHSPAPTVHAVNTFLGGWLDETRMVQMIDPRLYRQRT